MKGKKLFGVLLCMLLLICQLQIPVSAVSLEDSENNGEITWTDKGEFPYVTDVSITDGNGNQISESTFDRDGNINILFSFAIPNSVDIKAGDYYTIKIPEGFDILDDIPARQLDPNSGIDMTWELTGNVITIRALSDLGVMSNVNGYISIGCWFAKDSQLGQDGKPIEFVINGEVFKVTVYYDELDKSTSAAVSKSGAYNAGTREITWTVKVTPDAGSTLAGVTVKDVFDSTLQEYVEGSFSVNNKSESVTVTNGSFSYTFPENTDVGEKTIQFKTRVTDKCLLSGNTSVTNHAETYLENGDKSSETDAKVTVDTTMLKKAAVDWNAVTQSLTWEVTVNQNKVSLKNATVVDTYPAGTHIDTDTIRVNGAKTTEFEVDSSKNSITIRLGDINTQVKISYTLVVDDMSKLTQNSDGEIEIVNSAKLYSENEYIAGVEEDAWITPGTSQIPFTKNGSIYQLDGVGQTIAWQLIINDPASWNYQEINEKIVVTDVIPEGLQFNEDLDMILSVVFSDGDVKTVTIPSEECYNPSTKTFTYTIDPNMVVDGRKLEADCAFSIEFVTNITGPQIGKYTNKATILVDGRTEEAEKTIDVGYTDSEMIVKSGTYNYSEDVFDWKITFNKEKKGLVNPIVTDFLPENHVPAYDYVYIGALKVPLNGEAVSGVSATYNQKANTITINLGKYKNNMDEFHIFTKYDGEIDKVTSTNKVEFKCDNIDHSFTAEGTVTYTKLPELEKTTQYTKGNTITWQVAINLQKDNLKNLVLTDQLAAGLSLDLDSVKLELGTVSKDGKITSTGQKIALEDISYEEHTGLFTVKLPDTLDTTKPYLLYFDTKIADTGLTEISNSITLKGTGIEYSSTSKDIILNTTTSSSGIEGVAGSVKILKLDKETNKPIEGVSFQLLDKNKEVITDAGWSTTDSSGIAEFKNWLKLDNIYYIQEVRAKDGYVYDDTMYEVIVHSSDESTIFNIIVYNEPENKPQPETTTISGIKTWNDSDDKDGIRPDKITVNLYANGAKVQSVSVGEEDNWQYTFENLPKYENGKEIVYTISEESVPGYTTTVDGYNLVNTHKPDTPPPTEITINISGTKTWNDSNNRDGIRPDEITVNLYANGDKIQSVSVNEESNWQYTFENLPKYENGEEIVYTISEESVPGYTTTVNGYDIINTHTPDKPTPPTTSINISGTKTWNDFNDYDGIRPDTIIVYLFADGEKVQAVEIGEKENWKYTFSNLPKYEDGKEIVYTISEEEVTGYETKVEGYDLINTHKLEKPPVVDKPDNPTTPEEPENTPSTTTPDTNYQETETPKTGDTSNLITYCLLLAGTALALMITIIVGKKKAH